MRRGSSQLAASSVLVRPFTMPVALNSADAAATRISAASVRHMPPPYAAPFTAQMIGWRMRRIVRMRRE